MSLISRHIAMLSNISSGRSTRLIFTLSAASGLSGDVGPEGALI
jgi:hypothetical protein